MLVITNQSTSHTFVGGVKHCTSSKQLRVNQSHLGSKAPEKATPTPVSHDPTHPPQLPRFPCGRFVCTHPALFPWSERGVFIHQKLHCTPTPSQTLPLPTLLWHSCCVCVCECVLLFLLLCVSALFVCVVDCLFVFPLVFIYLLHQLLISSVTMPMLGWSTVSFGQPSTKSRLFMGFVDLTEKNGVCILTHTEKYVRINV